MNLVIASNCGRIKREKLAWKLSVCDGFEGLEGGRPRPRYDQLIIGLGLLHIQGEVKRVLLNNAGLSQKAYLCEVYWISVGCAISHLVY